MQASTRRRSLALWMASSVAGLSSSGLVSLAGVILTALSLVGGAVRAQTAAPLYPATVSQQQAVRVALNNNSLIVAAGHPDASYLAMAHDIAAALPRTGDVRLLPLAAAGGAENLRDLVFLRGVDLAIVPANVLTQTKTIEAQLGPGVTQRIAYVTHLYAEEVHLLVASSVGAIEGLRQRKVAVSPDDGNAQFTARDLFERLGIGAEIVRLRPAEAIDQVRSGTIAAALFVGGKPLQLPANLPKDGRLRLLNLPFPQGMEQGYIPATFRAEDYPTLIPPGLSVETVAVGAVLMANSARGYEESSRRLARFVPEFFAGIAELTLAGRHPKWRELNLAAPLPGWTRLPAAEEWLRNAREQQTAVLQKGFEKFLESTRAPGAPEIAPAERKKLFEEFVNWTRKSVGGAKEAERP